MKVKVLISSYNGERYLRQQLASILAQTQVGVEVLVRDDGSSDGTHAILEEYRNQGALTWREGRHVGASRSFWQLIRDSGDADFFAFCDQDDVWDNDKLHVAVATLRKMGESGPSLYCGDVRVVDSGLCELSKRMVGAQQPGFQHSLVKNIAPGCTFVFNRAACEVLRRYDAEAHGLRLHDWTAYQIIACFGAVHFDPEPHMSYRQHPGNAIGAVQDAGSEAMRKVRAFWSGPMRNSREQNALNLERMYGDAMPPENREIVADFAHYRTDPRRKRRLLTLRIAGLTHAEQLLLRALVAFNRL